MILMDKITIQSVHVDESNRVKVSTIHTDSYIVALKEKRNQGWLHFQMHNDGFRTYCLVCGKTSEELEQ